MSMISIKPEEIAQNPFVLLGKQWGLVTAADGERANPMTVSWGGVGILWNKPTATIYIRPQRYTHGLLEKENRFTLSFYPEEFRPALQLCGVKSGRDMDKAAEAGLTLIKKDGFCWYDAAELVLCCQVLYRDRIRPEGFSPEEKSITSCYPEKDYHDMYISEILQVIQRKN